MNPQRQTQPNTRSNPRNRYGFRSAPIRAQLGLAVRPSMNFGAMPDAVAVMRSSGLGLSPIAVSEASTQVGGTHILPTADVADIEAGQLKGLVVPAGHTDAASAGGLAEAITRARDTGVPVLAFGDGVATTLNALGRAVSDYAEAPAILVRGDRVVALADMDALAQAANDVT